MACPQVAIAHFGSFSATCLNCLSASAYQRDAAMATPLPNAFGPHADEGGANETVPRFEAVMKCGRLLEVWRREGSGNVVLGGYPAVRLLRHLHQDVLEFLSVEGRYAAAPGHTGLGG